MANLSVSASTPIALPCFIAESFQLGVHLRILRNSDGSLSATADGKEVPLKGIPDHVSPIHLEASKQLFQLGTMKWDGRAILVSPKLMGGGCCESTPSEERDPLVRNPPANRQPARQAAPINEHDGDEEHRLFIHYGATRNTGEKLLEQEKYDDALKYFKEALRWLPRLKQLKIIKDKDYEDNYYYLILNARVASHFMGNLSEAIKYQFLVLEQAKKIYGQESTNVSSAQNVLGKLYEDQEDFAKATEHYTNALELFKKLHGPEHEDVAAALTSRGKVHKAKGDLLNAKQDYFQALSIRKKLLGNDHPDLVNNLIVLGNVYYGNKEFLQAADYWNEAVAIKKTSLGEIHAEVESILRSIGEAYRDAENFDKAIAAYSESLNIGKRLHGEKSAEVATTLEELGYVFELKKSYSEAITYFTQAMHMRAEVLKDPAERIEGLRRLAVNCRKSGRPIEGIPFVEEALNIARAKKKADLELMQLTVIGSLYYTAGNLDKALAFYLQAAQLSEKGGKIDSQDLFTAFHGLGLVYLTKQDKSKALSLFEKARPHLVSIATESQTIPPFPSDKEGQEKWLVSYLEASSNILRRNWGEDSFYTIETSNALKAL